MDEVTLRAYFVLVVCAMHQVSLLASVLARSGAWAGVLNPKRLALGSRYKAAH
jgi:hypothetical protein